MGWSHLLHNHHYDYIYNQYQNDLDMPHQYIFRTGLGACLLVQHNLVCHKGQDHQVEHRPHFYVGFYKDINQIELVLDVVRSL